MIVFTTIQNKLPNICANNYNAINQHIAFEPKKASLRKTNDGIEC